MYTISTLTFCLSATPSVTIWSVSMTNSPGRDFDKKRKQMVKECGKNKLLQKNKTALHKIQGNIKIQQNTQNYKSCAKKKKIHRNRKVLQKIKRNRKVLRKMKGYNWKWNRNLTIHSFIISTIIVPGPGMARSMKGSQVLFKLRLTDIP